MNERMKDVLKVQLEDTLPEVLKRDDNVLATARAIDPELRKLATLAGLPALYANIDVLKGKQLDHMAYSRDATVWRDSWPDHLKRSMLRNIVKEKRLRGTVQAVKDALSSVQARSEIVEWWEYEPKDPAHTFDIFVTQSEIDGVLDVEMQEDLMRLIDDAKPLRSHRRFSLVRAFAGTLGLSAAGYQAVYTRTKCQCEKMRFEQKISSTHGVTAVMRPVVYARI